ncbi:DUF427 domain-containing protein [Methylomarinum sp. Ch1-1]|uniref:DUF427 domain-containing protein n=1 Tax=Methylomarinum roseum TaxID=3067653 RepID=A0AAU7NYM2_9GAMM|nr:DUF427 domain-containing protein [Methylomarinum sp. Ch1-1]MDP4521787.1 DUF427 domain-containing protein [Methylomarinum sp. Ch1-1]
MKAIWKNSLIAESDDIIEVEGNCYFPAASVNHQFLRASNSHTVCPWKGEASYYDVVVGNDVNRDAAWYYPEPKAKALNIKNRIAFWRGVEVTE